MTAAPFTQPDDLRQTARLFGYFPHGDQLSNSRSTAMLSEVDSLRVELRQQDSVA
jgi:hypothetical protein